MSIAFIASGATGKIRPRRAVAIRGGLRTAADLIASGRRPRVLVPTRFPWPGGAPGQGLHLRVVPES